MQAPDPLTVFDAWLTSNARGEMTTALDTEGLRDLGAEVLSRAVFTARGTNAIFTSRLKEVIDQLAAGDIGEGQARTALYEVLDAMGYTPEGGFPDAPDGAVPPAVRGSIQDLRSFRRMNLIISTQIDLMAGAGQQRRGIEPERLAAAPCWELVRIETRRVPRDWQARWTIAGGVLYQGRMIAAKGDPVWGELGSYNNFSDALGVDHPPFAFQSGMGWTEIEAVEAESLNVMGPDGETLDEFFASGPNVLAGKLSLPSTSLSMRGVDPELAKSFQQSTHATPSKTTSGALDFSDLLASELSKGKAAYQKANPKYQFGKGGE